MPVVCSQLWRAHFYAKNKKNMFVPPSWLHCCVLILHWPTRAFSTKNTSQGSNKAFLAAVCVCVRVYPCVCVCESERPAQSVVCTSINVLQVNPSQSTPRRSAFISKIICIHFIKHFITETCDLGANVHYM